ncbi:hypothetical protein [uncultured Stenotrophomonas sp.]|uniref:hypothetical protein n=1 Tax=uncultured Stenotrophomonas sp. TaxID=165438 RepID=UPI0025F279EF|nr:hypothetical protein [uncultured Stenotrophomonas sp.]
MSMAPDRPSTTLAALLFLMIMSCASAALSANAKEARSVVLVRLSPAQDAVLATGLLTGMLRPINGCVYFVNPAGTAYLAAWPHGYSLAMKGDIPIGVQDARSQRMLEFGATASFGGGHGGELLRSSLVATIPPACTGPIMTIHLIDQAKEQP